MTEEGNNVVIRCSKCSPGPMKERPDLEGKIGWFVKIPLTVCEETRSNIFDGLLEDWECEGKKGQEPFLGLVPTIEHVWIKVVWFDDESVEGTINNHPIYADELFGDTVIMPRDKIEDICSPEPPNAS